MPRDGESLAAVLEKVLLEKEPAEWTEDEFQKQVKINKLYSFGMMSRNKTTIQETPIPTPTLTPTPTPAVTPHLQPTTNTPQPEPTSLQHVKEPAKDTTNPTYVAEPQTIPIPPIFQQPDLYQPNKNRDPSTFLLKALTNLAKLYNNDKKKFCREEY
jgi:hypothetical protein